MPRGAEGGLKAIAGKRVDSLSLDPHSCFVSFCFFQPESCFPGRQCSKASQHMLDIVGLSHAVLGRANKTRRIVKQLLLLFHEKKPKENKGSSKDFVDEELFRLSLSIAVTEAH